MKEINLNLTVTFDEELTPDQILQVAHNINCAIIRGIGGQGIAPEDSEAVTDKVTLTNENGIISLGTPLPGQVTTGTVEEGDQLTTRVY